MEKKFDGDPIRSGDTLWKVGFGPAKVVEIRHDTVLVDLQGRPKKFSLKTGVQSGERHRTYFWFDPIIVIPRKNAANWNALKGIVLDMTNRLGQYLNLFGTLDDEAALENLTVNDLDQRGLITVEMKERANHIALQGLLKQAREESNVTNIQESRG